MVSQLNPAWQRKSASSSRLAEISARFLGETQESKQGNDLCQAIPFFLDGPEQRWITDELARILTERGHPCSACHWGDSNDPESSSPTAHGDTACATDAWCVLAVSSPDKLLRQDIDHVVLLVQADLDGVRIAYQRIKLLAQHGGPDIGIVLVGPRDQHAAWRYFRKLAVGALRYLDVPLLNLGFLPEQIAPGEDAEASHRHNFLARIGERLLHSGFYSTITTGAAQRGT